MSSKQVQSPSLQACPAQNQWVTAAAYPYLAELRTLCDKNGMFLLEDCALSLFSDDTPADGRTGDVSFFCFYKFFQVIAGGAMVANRTLPHTLPEIRPAPFLPVAKTQIRSGIRHMSSYKILTTIRQSPAGKVTTPARATGQALDSREALPDMPAHYYFDPRLRDRGISALTLHALRGQNIEQAVRQRQANYRDLAELLRNIPEVRLLHPELAPVSTGHSGMAMEARGSASGNVWDRDHH